MRQSLLVVGAIACGLAAQTAHGRGGGGCLAEGTQVLTPQGERPIQDLREGDEVLAYSETRAWVKSRVLATTEVEAETSVELTTPQGKIEATPEHPFLTGLGRYGMAASLEPGHVALFDSTHSRLDLLAVRPNRHPPRKFYNLTTEWPNTFVANGMIVHNKGCFLPDTEVALADGRRRAISEIRPGMKVLAYSSEGEPTITEVQEVYHLKTQGYFEITTSRGHVVRATAEHPFYLGEGQFRTVEELRAGDTLITFTEGFDRETIESIVYHSQAVEVFNLRTDQPHTFIANGFAVHNKGGGGGFHSSRSSSRNSGHYFQGRQYTRCDDIPDPNEVQKCRSQERHRNFIGFSFLAFFPALALLLGLGRRFQGRNFHGELDHMLPPRQYEPKAQKTEALLESLAASLPHYQVESLREVVTRAFLTLQRCWQARDYGEMSHLVFPALREQHLLQIQSLRRNGEINRIEDIRILAIRFVQLRYVPDQVESWTALIEASAKDFYVDEQTGAKLRGDDIPAPFQELWTFQLSEGSWKLFEIEQVAESEAIRESNQVPEGLPPSNGEQAPAAPGNKLSLLIAQYGKIDGSWNETAMKERARQDSIRLHACLENGSIELLQDRATPKMLAETQTEIQNLRTADEAVEFRNLCARQVSIVLVRDDLYAARVSMHAKRAVFRNGIATLQDPDVTPFEILLTYVKNENGFLLDECAKRERTRF